MKHCCQPIFAGSSATNQFLQEAGLPTNFCQKQCCQPIFFNMKQCSQPIFAGNSDANRFLPKTVMPTVFLPDAVLPTYFSVLHESVLPTCI
jgi:hypothetical protein